ncbi:MerR family transcriptional regulator [Streptomyces sp. NBC_00199]|uniref:MerR family transcriptional regulator n=1 Tax=Streptomyces sp. NBC_00199 TaxID=2975678 RepID=UPI0022568580|nr:MerR family transcriptional regulator [Streptomyces sp. NBC_00199]MCX5265686.1 MerR family transcriptional regulator [Streptomyces sp. NBC_00199]
MPSSFMPPRQVKIGDVAAFAGSTPRAIRHYHEIGLLPEPERGGDDRRRYEYDDMIRLLWIRKMADAGIALDDIRDAFTTGTTSVGSDSGEAMAGILERLEETLAGQEAELRRKRTAVQRKRTEGSRMGLLSDIVTERLKSLPEGYLRQADLDSLLVTERIFGPPPATADDGQGEGEADLGSGRRRADLMSVFEATGKTPYDFSPARLRCMELAEELSARDSPAS